MENHKVVRMRVIALFFIFSTAALGFTTSDVVDGITVADFIDVLVYIESNGRENAIGKHGERGVLQITEAYAVDVGMEFPILCRERSSEAFLRYMDIYCKNVSLESMARIHNGGPNGNSKKSTDAYWDKVQKRLKVVKNGK